MDRDKHEGIEVRNGKRGSTIRLRFVYRSVECRETLKLEPTPANLRYAARLRGEILNAIEKRTFSYGDYFPDSKRAALFGHTAKRTTIGVMLKAWLADCEKAAAKGNMSPATINGYRKVIKGQLMPQWEHTALQDLQPAALRQWIGAMATTAKTTRNVLGPLRAILGDALNDGLITANPLDRIDLSNDAQILRIPLLMLL